jgi:predicted site-specific integrase-resolvase
MNFAAWAERTGVARVSSADQKAGLDCQVTRVAAWATTEQVPVDRVVTGVGSALNGHRRKFLALLRDPFLGRIVVEHRDRFCRFGSEYVEAALVCVFDCMANVLLPTVLLPTVLSVPLLRPLMLGSARWCDGKVRDS